MPPSSMAVTLRDLAEFGNVKCVIFRRKGVALPFFIPPFQGLILLHSPFPVPSSAPNLRKSFHFHIAPSTTSIVPMPPPTTEMTGPNIAAVTPLSNPPKSLEVPMKTLFTADTLPRISSGVSTCTRVERMTTLMLSSAPVSTSAAIESQNHCESPKTIVAAPKPVTAQSIALPARFIGGRCARMNAMANAPMAGAARSQPSPSAPVWRMSLANIGSSAVAPPRNTANKSSVIVAKMILVLRT